MAQVRQATAGCAAPAAAAITRATASGCEMKTQWLPADSVVGAPARSQTILAPNSGIARPMLLDDLPTPSLLLDLDRLERNCDQPRSSCSRVWLQRSRAAGSSSARSVIVLATRQPRPGPRARHRAG